MIDPAQKKLNTVFLFIIITFNILILAIIFFFLHYRLIDAAKNHIIENTATEFMPHYNNNDLATLNKLIDDEYFQVLDRQGNVVLDVQTSVHFRPRLNERLFRDAFSGSQVFETLKQEDISYMVSYSPLGSEHILRVTMSMEDLAEFQRNFFLIILFTFPAMLVLSFILSRYMVNQSLKPVKRVLTYQETFSSNITHELNSPLTSIKGNLEVSLKKERTPEEYRDAMKTMLNRVNGIIYLLNNLFLLATSKFKPLDLLKEQVKIRKIIDGLEEKYEPIILSNKISLNIDIPPDAVINCDTSLIERAVENLMDNAVNYTPKNGFIEITTVPCREGFALTISNSCDSVTNNDIRNFFTPFYRGSDRSEGKGLGLHIVQYIIESHGGKVTANLDKKILTFTLLIPHQG